MGTLLAQVIPVLALALVLELRSNALKPETARRDDSDESIAALATYAGVVVAVILTAGEQMAIAAAAGNPDWNPLVPGDYLIPDSPLLGFGLQLCVYAVFLLPAVQALIVRLPRIQSSGLVGSLGAFLVLVLVSLSLPLLL